MQKITCALRTFVKKVVYPMTIASLILGALGPAAFPLPAHAAFTSITATAIATSPQTLGPSSNPTAALALNVVANTAETLTRIFLAINPMSGFTLGDLAALGTGATAGIALYKDTGSTEGAFDGTDPNVVLGGVPVIQDGSSRISKLQPSDHAAINGTNQVVGSADGGINLQVGDLLFGHTTANSGYTNNFTWHLVTTTQNITTDAAPGALRLDNNTNGAPTFAASTEISKLTPASTGSYTINGTSNTTTPALAAGDIIFYQANNMPLGTWGMVTGNFTASAAPVDGQNLANATYTISKLASQTATFTVNATDAITFTGTYTTPQVGDVVLYQTGTQAANRGVVTNATPTSGTFAVDGNILGMGNYRISKITAYTPSTFAPSAIPTTIARGDLLWGLPTSNPVTTAFEWHIATGATTNAAADLRLDGRMQAPIFGLVATLIAGEQFNIPNDNNGANAGADLYLVVRTSANAVNNHAFTLGVAPMSVESTAGSSGTAPAETVTQTYTIATTAQQTQSAGANTVVFDMTGGFLKLKQGSALRPAMSIQFGSNENNKTLTSIALTFAGTSGSPTWTQGQAVSSELLDLATTGGGVSLWKDAGAPGFQGTGDTEVTLAANPVYGAGNTLTLTPATAPMIASDNRYFIVLKSDTSGVTNNNAFTVALATNAITTSGQSPTIQALTTPPIVIDTAAPTITAAEGFANNTALTVKFSEQVQRITAGGALTTADFTYTNDATNGSGRTLNTINHAAGQDRATITMNDNFAAGDFDGTPSKIKAGTNKIEDMAGNVMASVDQNLSSPLDITTSVIPATFVGANHTTTPLVTFAAAGGSGTGYQFTANAQADTDTLTALGLTLATNGNLTGTIAANTAGSRNVAVKVTDSLTATFTKVYTFSVSATQGGGAPSITQISPPTGAQNATNRSVTITGTNTSFAGTSVVAFLLNGTADTNITVGPVTATSATSLTVPLTIAGGAATGARDVRVTTGTQVVIISGMFNVTGAVAEGLNLAFPTDNATGIQIPIPVFNFNPSTNTSITHYRVVVSTVQDFATTVFDYVFEKPADAQNTNGSHCTSTNCNVPYGEGKFLRIAQPTSLVKNTRYYWKVETYQDPTPTTPFAAADITEQNRRELTPVRNFTTVTSLTDTHPPVIQHRPVNQAAANTNLTIFARVTDDIAKTTTTPALTTKIFYCAGSGCNPTTEGAAPTPLGGDYFSYAIPSATIGNAATVVRYYLQASDGTSTVNFKQPDQTTPFQLTSVAAGTGTIAGTVKDSTGTCSTAVSQATVFIEGTGLSATSSNDTNCTFTVSNVFAGSYELTAFKDGFSDLHKQGIASGATGIEFKLTQGQTGGFGGDASRPHIRFTAPFDQMRDLPGDRSDMRVIIGFDKPMSQATILASGNMTVGELNTQNSAVTDITSTKGSWAYYPTFTMPFGPQQQESNVAVWSLSGTNTLGDQKTFVVKVTQSVTDTNGNAVQGNQSDGGFTMTFSTRQGAATTGGQIIGGTLGEGAFVTPRVQGITPVPGSFNVPRNTKVTITFSKTMADDDQNCTTGYCLKNFVKLFEVNETTFAETDKSSDAINSVALDSEKRVAILNLKTTFNQMTINNAATGTFAASTKYRLKVLAGAKSSANVTLQAADAQSADFKTSATTNTAAPTVTGSAPDANATNVQVGVGSVKVSFDSFLDRSTVTSSTVSLAVGSSTVTGTVEYRDLSKEIVFIPNTALSASTTYTLTITTDVKGLNGIALAAAVSRSFTTGAADTVAPGVADINADDFNLVVRFTEAMNAAKATDSENFAASVLKPGNYAIKFGSPGFDPTTAGSTLTLPATATLVYDPSARLVMIQGFRPESITSETLRGNSATPNDIFVTATSVKDISGNAIGTSNTARSSVRSSANTQGNIGVNTGGNLNQPKDASRPENISSTTHGYADGNSVFPLNQMAGQTTIYKVKLTISKQIPSGGKIVLTFPEGFDVNGAMQDVNGPNRADFNGPTVNGTPTFKCGSNGTNGRSCAGTANATDTGTVQGGLSDDGVEVNTSINAVTIYINGGTRSESSNTNDSLDIDIAGVKNSTIPKDFSTGGYVVDVKTKNAAGDLLESLTPGAFFLQSAGSNSLSGTITATGNNQNGTMRVFLESMRGFFETTSSNFNAGTTATYTFSNLPDGEYRLRTEPLVSIGTSDFVGITNAEVVDVDAAGTNANAVNATKNFTLANASAGGTVVTVTLAGPASEALDVFAGSPQGFRKREVTLDGTGAGNVTLNLPDGEWFLGVGPRMPKDLRGGPPPMPTTYLMPKPKNMRITNPTCTVEGTVGCNVTFTLTSTSLQIKGVVEDASNKILGGAEVFAYDPIGLIGTRTEANSDGGFTLNVANGNYKVAGTIRGMPPSKDYAVVVNNDPNKGGHATNYLFIDGATIGKSPTEAATSFVLKVAKPDFTITGKVTDGTDVVQNAMVYAHRTDGPGYAGSPTDNTGSYTLYVATGTWKVKAFIPQYGEAAEQTVSITTASVSDINFAPSQTGTFYNVSGTVTLGGAAVANAFVRIEGALNGRRYSNETTTSSTGAYTVKAPAGTFTLRANVPRATGGFIESAPTAAFTITNADVANQDIAIAALSTVTFTFSQSVERGMIRVQSTTTPFENRDGLSNKTTATLEVPNGSYRVYVDIEGVQIALTNIAGTDANTAYANTTGIVTVDGAEGLTVTLPTRRTITGTVTDGTNQIPDAWVEIFSSTTRIRTGGRTGTTGAFSIKVPDGTYFINAMKPGYYREPSTLVVNAQTGAQTVTMAAAPRTISGQVIKSDSTAVDRAHVWAELQGGTGFAGTESDASGNYTLSVGNGIWKVFAVAEGFAVATPTETIDVSTSSATGKNITLSQTVSRSEPKSRPITPSSGGTLEDTTNGVKINVPANALGTSSSSGTLEARKSTIIRETKTSRPIAPVDITATDADGNRISTLNDDVTVDLIYTKAELAATASDTDSSINTKTEVDKLQLGYWDETAGDWITIPTTITYLDSSDVVVGTPAEDLSNISKVKLSGTTNHFSLYAPVVSTDPSAPSTPTNFAVGTVTQTTIPLSWTAVSGATGYNIYRSVSSTGTFTRLGSEPTVSSGSTATYTDSGLSASQTFFYKISAVNTNGESAASSAVSGTTSAATTTSSSGSGSIVSSTASTTSTTTTSTTTTTTTTKKEETAKDTAGKEMAWGFKDGKFQLMTKAEADVLHEAAEAAKRGAIPATPAQRAIPGERAAIPAVPATPPAKATKAERVTYGSDRLVDTVSSKTLTKLPELKRVLGVTTHGEDVKTLQNVLQSQGFYKGTVTGVMNKATQEAVKQFQLANKIATKKTKGFGEVGPSTRAFINNIVKEAKAEVAPSIPVATPKKVKQKASEKTVKEEPSTVVKTPVRQEEKAPSVKKVEPKKKESSALEKLRKLLKE